MTGRSDQAAKLFAAILGVILIAGCSGHPVPIRLGEDTCNFCHMLISNKNFGAEILSQKGHHYKFDDPFCLTSFRALKMDSNLVRKIYLVNYGEPHNFIALEDAALVKSNALHSPMGGNVAAFDNEDSAHRIASSLNGIRMNLQEFFGIWKE